MRRRTLLRSVGTAAAAWLLGSCAPGEARPPTTLPGPPAEYSTQSPVSPGPATARPPIGSPSPAATARRVLGYVFNTAGQDVTIFDAVTHQIVGTRSLGTAVTWLSNEQRFWDGRYIWTYDYPESQVRAIAIDPLTMTIARTIPAGGRGPAHSLMLTPDLRTAWVNVAGEDYLAVLDISSGQMIAQVKTGKFP